MDQPNPSHGTSYTYQIQHLTDIFVRKDETYKKKVKDLATLNLKVKNARSKMAQLNRDYVNIQKENADLEQHLA